MKVVVSSGFGRLHFVESVRALSPYAKISFVTGWVPNNVRSWFVRLVSAVSRRDVSSGLAKRKIDIGGVQTCQCAFVDIVGEALMLLFSRLRLSKDRLATFNWKCFGWASRRFLKDARVFHVRSGAGQGGAISMAKSRGMKVVVDHSIAHPSFMSKALRTEFEENGKVFDMGMENRFWQLVDKDCREADVVLVNSDFVKKTFVEAGYPPEMVKVIYLGVREDFLGLRRSSTSGTLRLLFTGHFSFRKGAKTVVDVVSRLKHDGVDFRLDVYGSSSGAEALVQRCLDEDLPVEFHGYVPQDELKGAFASSDIYLFPSLSEGCAKSAQEAMAAGLCPVVTEETGIPVTDGVNGFIVNPHDVGGIVEKIVFLSTRRDVLDEVGRAASAYIARNCKWDDYARNVVALYEELCSEEVPNE